MSESSLCGDATDVFGLGHRHDLTETTRAMAKRGSEDLKKLTGLQATLVSPWCDPREFEEGMIWGVAAVQDVALEDVA